MKDVDFGALIRFEDCEANLIKNMRADRFTWGDVACRVGPIGSAVLREIEGNRYIWASWIENLSRIYDRKFRSRIARERPAALQRIKS